MAVPVEALRLPPLREDLRLLPGAASHDGAPTWTLHDPASHRFMRVGWMEFEILSRWGLGDVMAVAEAVTRETTLTVSPIEVLEVLAFADRAGLLWVSGPQGAARLQASLDARRMSAAKWLLKNYLFLRVRLIDPDRMLTAMLRRVGWAFTSAFPLILVALALLGLYLVGRQWEAFLHTLPWMFTLEGALLAGLALTLSKVAHELGHGLAARRFGCRVPAMGVALLVLWPVLWTDVTDAWKLTDRRQRLVIDAAGMAAEIALAALASIAWVLLPSGAARSAAFVLASSTWLLTLAVNLNPLMRFDGYFLLADLLDEPNLQDRAFAMGRWWLRERLFALGDPAPETLAPTRRTIFITYALATWIYRFFLFLGIALLVYHFAFKLLGIFLMAVEIGWFIARPITAELAEWRRRLGDMRWNSATRLTATLAALAVLLLVLPWRGQATAPALLRPERQTTLYTAQAGQLAQLTPEGGRVAAGEALFTLVSPDIEARRRKAEAEATGLHRRLAGLSFDNRASDSVELAWQTFDKAVAEWRDLSAQSDALVVRAPFAGVVVDLPTYLRPGLWMGKREALGVLMDPASWMVEAYVDEASLSRVAPGDRATFYAENGEAPVALAVAGIDDTSTRELAVPELASVNGGGVPVRETHSHRLVPENSVYRVLLRPADGTPPATALRRGTVVMDASAESILAQLWRHAVAVVVRESGL